MESEDLLSFYMPSISSLLSQQKITEQDHHQILHFIDSKDIHLINIAKSASSQEKIEEDLLRFLQVKHKPEAVIISHSSNNEEMSSPLGTFLHEKKKRQHAEHELKLSVATTDIDSIIESHDDH